MKIKSAEWEIVIVATAGDKWPIVAHDDSGFDMDPDEVNVGFAAVADGPPRLMPPGVSGRLVHDGRASATPAYQEMPTETMPDWLETAVTLAADRLGIKEYEKGEVHDRRDHLRPV
jgi:hypothetical protein